MLNKITMNNKKRNVSIDYLKSIAIVFVIITHSDYGKMHYNSPLFYYVIDSAVPFFVFISGYLYSRSFASIINKTNNVFNWILSKFVRFVVPYTIAFIIEILISLLFTKTKYIGDCNLLITYLLGGIGPGSYYFPLMMQFIILFPFLFNFVKKYEDKSIMYGLLLNIAYELIKNLIFLSEDVYRLLIFRYLFIIIFGIYIEQNNEIRRNRNYLMMAIGFIYITLINANIISPIIFTQWNSTCMVSSMLWLPIASFLICYSNLKENTAIINISKSSFNIFLVQMVYFFLDIPKFLLKEKLIIELVIDIFMCIIIGIIFYKIENMITKYIVYKIEQ